MLIASLVVGGLTAYWFGLRPGLWAAAATLALCLLAVTVPALATPIYLALAAGLSVVCIVGPRRERPADAARVVRLAKSAFGEVRSRIKRRLGDTGRRDGNGRP